MPIFPPFINGFPYASPLFPSVQPFTQRDGTAYLEILRALSEYVSKLADKVNDGWLEADEALKAQIAALQDTVNTALEQMVEQVDTQLEAQDTQVSAQLTAQDGRVTAQLLAQSETVTQQLAAQNVAVTQLLQTQVQEFNDILASLQAQSIEFSDPVLLAIIGDDDTNSRQKLDRMYQGRTVHIVPGWGQSNMSGRGKLSPGDNSYLPRPANLLEYGFKNRTLRQATEILDHQDTPTGIGPLYDFGLQMVRNVPESDVVVLAPAAQGASALVSAAVDSWNPNVVGSLFQRARAHLVETIATVKAAYPDAHVQVSTLLWHQGEGDNTFQAYMASLRDLIIKFREVAGPNVPVVIGQMQPKNFSGGRYNVNQAHTTMARNDDFIAFAGMPRDPKNDIGDGTHFNARGQRMLAANMWLAFKRAVVNLQPRQEIQSAVGVEFAGDQFNYNGIVTKDTYGSQWSHQGSSAGNSAQFIADGSFCRIDPNQPGAGRGFILMDCYFNRRVRVRTQWGAASSNNYRVILAYANSEDYLFMGVDNGFFRLGRYQDGTTTYLGQSAIASNVGETAVAVGATSISGVTGSGTLFGGDWPIAIPSDFEGGTMYGASMQSATPGDALLNWISFEQMDARP